MRINFSAGGQPGGPLGKLAAAVVGAVALAVGLMFSLVFVVVVVVAGIGIWAYFWWKTRALRRHLREQAEQAAFGQQPTGADEPSREGDVIDGEAVRVVDEDKRLN